MVIATATIPPASGGAEINRRRYRRQETPEPIEDSVALEKPDRRDISEKTLDTVSCSDDESSCDGSYTKPKKSPRRVSLEESNNEVFEVARIHERYKTRCWITKEELEHNFMMNRVRNLVEQKLIKLLSKNDEFFAITSDDTDDTETETEGEDELLDGLLGKELSTTTLQPQQHEEKAIKRGLVPARRDRILQHLCDSIMERQKRDIHSFLTSKCSISFSRKPKKKQ